MRITRHCRGFLLAVTFFSHGLTPAVGAVDGRQLPYRVVVARWNLHQVLEALAQKYDLKFIAESYSTPRSHIAERNERRTPLIIEGRSLIECLDRIAKEFAYEWSENNGVYVFKNRTWVGEPAWRVPSDKLDFAKKYGDNNSFRFLAHFLDVNDRQVQSLAEQYPQLHALRENSPRRFEAETYVLLPVSVRERFDLGEKVKWSEIPTSVQGKVTELVRRKVPKVTLQQMATTTHWLEKFNRWGEQKWMFSGAFSAS